MNNIFIKNTEIASWVAEKYFKGKDLISLDEILCALEDASDDLDILQEKYEDFKQEVEENYRYTPQT